MSGEQTPPPWLDRVVEEQVWRGLATYTITSSNRERVIDSITDDVLAVLRPLVRDRVRIASDDPLAPWPWDESDAASGQP